jgi:hypothetical protein
MNPEKKPEDTVETLLALRNDSDAVRLITEQLRVKEMGPADHIRTKHEVKAFVESGDVKAAETLVQRAAERRLVNLRQTLKTSQRLGQRVSD